MSCEREIRQNGKQMLYNKVTQMLNAAVDADKIPEWVVDATSVGLGT